MNRQNVVHKVFYALHFVEARFIRTYVSYIMYDRKYMSNQSDTTESTLSTTPPEKQAKIGRPPRSSAAPVPWSIRGVEPETRRVLEKAADRAGKTLGQYINDDVRGFAQSQLVKAQSPIAPMDIQNQIDHLTKIVEGIANRLPEQGRKSVWQRLFG